MKRNRSFDDKAQLLLVAGFAVGVGIVVLTVMLNNVIYASNIASESSIDTSRYDIANAIQMSTEVHEDAYKSATQNGSFDNATYEKHLEAYEEIVSKNYAISGFTFSMENSALHEAYFTQNGLSDGRNNWTVVSNINTTEVFLLEINDTAKLGNSSNSLMITATNDTGIIWSLEIYNSSGNINITVSDDSSVIGTYTASTQLNVTGNKIDFTTPKSFYFNDYTDGEDYSINIINGGSTVGYCTLSGRLSNGESYTYARYWVADPTITMRSSEISIVRDLPISLPGRIL